MKHHFFYTQNNPHEPPNGHGNHHSSEIIQHIKKSLLPLGGFLSILTLALVSTHIVSGLKKSSVPFVKQTSHAVLGAQASPLNLQGNIVFNIPAAFNQDVTFNKAIIVDGNTTLNGSLTVKGQSLNLGQGTITASNVLYGITAGTGLSLTTGQNPTLTNNGVTSLQGNTGAITLTAGNGISISGTTITNSDPGSSAKSFATISDGTTSLVAGNNDTLTFSGGTGISLSLDTTNKKLTITNTGSGGSTTIDLTSQVTGVLPVANGGTNLSSYSAGDLLYASGTTTLSKLGIGSSNTVLTSNGTSPAWSSLLTLTGLTVSGTATTSGLNINGNTILGASSSNTIDPLGLFSGSLLPSATTVNLGSSNNQFGSVYAQNIYQNGTALSQYWQQNNGALSPFNITNDVLIGGTSSASAKLILSGTTGNITATGALSGLTGLTVNSGSVSFPTNTIANTALANSSITINTGTGLSGGGIVALGGTLTLTNTQSGGVTSLTGTANQIIASGSTGAVTLSLPQSIATTSTPTFGGLTINGNSTLGTSISNTITPIASFAGSLVPSLTDSYNLGSLSNEWNNVYAKNLVVNSNQIANIYSDTEYLNKNWNTTALLNSTGTTFSSGMQNPATNNQLNIKPGTGSPLLGWAYQKAITITNNAGALTNYQVSVTVDTASLISAGKMNSDCSDIRFTDSDASTTINFWLESGCNTSSTQLWVKIPSISASSTKTIYMYYGNSGATSASSGTNTFTFFDDFTTLDTTNTWAATGTTSLSSGQLTVSTGSVYTKNSVTSLPGFIVEANVKFSNPNSFLAGIAISNANSIGVSNNSNGNKAMAFLANGGGPFSYIGTGSNASWDKDGGTTEFNYTPGTYSIIGEAVDSSNFYYYNNRSLTHSYSGSYSSSSPSNYLILGYYPGSLAGTTDATDSTFDWVLVRQFSSTPPTTSVGSETTYYTSGVQSWTSDTIDAGSGVTYKPNYLTVNYTLDGSDNIAPKFQIEGSSTGSFTGEQTIYPAGSGTYYQSGGTYPISSGTALDISAQVTNKFRYWKVIGYMDTGATITDTPTITSVQLQESNPLLLNEYGQYVGIGTTSPTTTLDVNGGFHVSSSLAVGYNTVPSAVGNAIFSGQVGIGTSTPGATSALDVLGGRMGIGTTSPQATLDVQSILGTMPVASISGKTSMSSLIVDNSGTGDIFTASSSGLTRFVVTQNGSVGIGTGNPTRNLDIVGNAVNNSGGTASQLSIYGTGSSSNRLNIGYNTTSNYGWIEAVNQSIAWQNLYLQPDGGSVIAGTNMGIGTSSINATLDLGANAGTNKLYLYDAGTAKYGFGAANGTLQLYTGAENINNAISFNRYDGSTLTEMARIQNGTLAIGSSSFLAQAGIDVEKSGLGNSIAVFNQTASGDILTASSSGSTKFTIKNNGNVAITGSIGIGTTSPLAKLDVSDTQASTVSAFIRNLNTGANASGLAIQLGNNTPGTGNYFLSFLNGAGSIVGKIQGNGSGGISYATSGIDFAEYYKKASNSGTLIPGTIVCETKDGLSSCNDSGSILGVISDKAGFVGGIDHADDPTYALVGMVGQLQVTISTTSEVITRGDPLTVGVDGEAIKATTAGQIVGHALEDSKDAQNGQIMVAVNVSWYDPSFYNLATSAVLGASTSALDEQLLTVQNATVSGTLNVMGRTTLSDVGITGNVNDGLLTIHGLDGSINTLAGDLNLQSEGLGGINMLNGLVTIDTQGNITTAGSITAQTVTAQTFVIKGTGSAGTASIPRGQTSLEIDTPVMNTTAKVFVTPNTSITVPLIVSEKQYGKFFVKIAAPQSNTVTFDWFIIKSE